MLKNYTLKFFYKKINFGISKNFSVLQFGLKGNKTKHIDGNPNIP